MPLLLPLPLPYPPSAARFAAPDEAVDELCGLEYRMVARITRVDPVTKASVGSKSKAGMNHERTEEMTIESEVAKPLTTLSAYFMMRPTSRPPAETWRIQTRAV